MGITLLIHIKVLKDSFGTITLYNRLIGFVRRILCILSYAHFPYICCCVLIAITYFNWTSVKSQYCSYFNPTIIPSRQLKTFLFHLSISSFSYIRDISLLNHQFLKLSSVLTFGRTWELRQGHRALCNKFLLYGPPSIPWTLGPRFQSTSQFTHPEFIFFTVKVKT